jgi:predicted MFS family arabinose efflux permease
MGDQVQLWQVYAAALLLGSIQALNMPARMAMIADLVDRGDIMNAVSLNSMVMNLGRILGPLSAGGVIASMGIGPAMAFNAGWYFLGTGFLFFMNDTAATDPVERPSIIRDLFTGLRYVLATPVALTIIGVGYTIGLLGMPVLQVLPAYAKETFGVGPGGAGLLITAVGVGSLLGSIFLASLGNFRQKNWLLLGSILIFCFSLILFTQSPWFWLSWVLLLLVGVGSMSYVSMVSTVLQMTVPRPLQGRVLSVWSMGGAMMFVGALPMGAVADAFGWTSAVVGGPVITLVFVIWLGMFRPTIRRLQV